MPETSHTCCICSKVFSSTAALLSHTKWMHETPTQHKCSKCERTFPKRYNLVRHIKTVHDDSTNVNTKCSLCPFVSHSKRLVFDHYQTFHSIDLTPKTVHFATIEQFMQWKKDFEMSTNSQFIRPLSVRKLKNGSEVHKYICHRDGNYVPKGNNLRNIKVQGSNKINAHCPAQMMMQNGSDGIKVSYIDHHVGHELEIGRMNIDQTERALIAERLKAKVPFRQILDEIRDSVTNEQFNRIHMLNRKDLWNIAHSFNIKLDASLHKSDYGSVDDWVSFMQSSSNTIRVYKPQGTVIDGFAELTSDDFFLVIMNDAQKELLESFGEDCVCVDGTHGMEDACNFHLFTLMVLDDLRQSFPCAFLFSNRGDKVAMELFFKTLRFSLEHPIKPLIFLSDADDLFYNAWCATMEVPDHWLYCSWHVDRDWRSALSKISDREEQVVVYKNLRILMYESDQQTFALVSPSFFRELQENEATREFGEYFQKYMHTTSRWAFCFREEADIGIYMSLENMHRVLKYIYSDGNKEKSMDKAIHMLMKYIRDKLFDRHIVLKRGKVSSKLREMKARHKKAIDSTDYSVTEAENHWLVQSTRHKDVYMVSLNNVECACLLRCEDCEVCIHAYQCTCIDSAIKWNMCRHMHLVCMFQKSRLSQVDLASPCIVDVDNPQVIVIDVGSESEVIEVTTENEDIEVTPTNYQDSFEKRKEDALDKFMKIHAKIQNEEQLQAFVNQVAPLEDLINTLSGDDRGSEESLSKKMKIQDIFNIPVSPSTAQFTSNM